MSVPAACVGRQLPGSRLPARQLHPQRARQWWQRRRLLRQSAARAPRRLQALTMKPRRSCPLLCCPRCAVPTQLPISFTERWLWWLNTCLQLAPGKCLPLPFLDMACYDWPCAKARASVDNEAEEVMSPAVMPKVRERSVALTMPLAGKKPIRGDGPPPSCTGRFRLATPWQPLRR